MSQHDLPLPALPDASAQFDEVLEDALRMARELGASDCVAEISESQGLNVSVRLGQLETVEQTRDRSLDVTVYVGQRRGSASTSDFSKAALRQTIEAARNIAQYTAEDPAAGLPETSMLAQDWSAPQLHAPWSLSTSQAAELALRAEQSALRTHRLIQNSEGASVSTHEGRFLMANSRGFKGGFPYSRHSMGVAPIAVRGDDMQRDDWYTSARRAQDLAEPESLGRYAAERALSRLGAKRLKTGRFPVIFEAPLALGLIGHLTHALSGGSLYRKASFLTDSLGQSVMPEHLSLLEDPFVPWGMGTSPFDDEGVRTQPRQVVHNGRVEGYFLSTYTGRKLGMTSTGNAGGSHNLRWISSRTRPTDTLPALLAQMHRGILVTELIGQGVNYVTGDYSRGAFGYWVENGLITGPVQEFTIAGNLREMFHAIEALGADEIVRGSKCSGSVLIGAMQVAGQ